MAKEIKLPRGIRIMRRATCETIQIAFTYRCVECKEILHIPPTKENLKKAEHKRIIMLGEIESGAFNYFEHFPNSKSKTAKMFSKANPSILKITVGELLNKQLNDYQRTYEKGNLSISTLTGYKKITNHLLKHFSSIEIQALSAAHLEEWLFQQSLDNITLKTVNNRLILLKALVKDAFRKKLIPMNIFDEIDMKKELNKTAVKSDFVIEPFTEEEKEIIINAASGEVRNLIQFNFWAGLRTSELIALKWEDIDFENELIHIKRAKVEKEIKTTKTKAGIRKIVMLPKAKEALLAQLPLTKNCEYVFNNPNTGEAWQSSNILANAWRKVINKTSVSYRNCYQMRHTYASTLISNGEKVFWVSEQMGHENTEMIFKHYGKWIPQDAKNGYSFVGKY